MAAILSRPQCVNTLLSRQSSFYFADDVLISILLIWVTFAYVIFMKWIWRRRLRKYAILSLPVCVNTPWQRQNDLYFEDHIFNFILNFRWDLILKKIMLKWIWQCRIQHHVVSASMFNTHEFRGRDKMVALFKTIFWNSFSYRESFYYSFFSKFTLNVFQNFQIQIYCIILSSCTEIDCKGANAVHRMTSLYGNVFLDTLPMWMESTGHRWIPRTKGKWYRGVFARVWSPLPGSFCTHEPLVCFTACVKRLPPSQWQAGSGLVWSWLCAS